MMMEPIYKQYAALATKWSNDLFFRARIKLTSTYVGISTLILAVFSYLLYRALLVSFAESITDHVPDLVSQTILFNRATDALQSQILFIDGVTMVIVLVCGYILTTLTLRPIREARDRERRFLADAAHEFRTPLSVMRSGTEVVLRGEHQLSPRVKKVLSENLDEIDSLTKIANSLLSLVSEKTKIVQDTSLIDMSATIQGIVDKLKPLADEKQLTLSYKSIDIQDIVHIHADEVSLTRIFENCIENAIKYTPRNGSVTVLMECARNIVVVRIVDTGIGIDAHDIPHVTEPFFRADTARTGTEGSGLGLSIVADAVETLHGTLLIESGDAGGTTVTIQLPVII